MGIPQYRDGFKLTLAPHTLEQPYHWKKPKIVFVNSMSDLFHKNVPSGYIKRVFEVMNNTPTHTYQILTKRSDRLKELASELKWTANIWMGVSIEEEAVTSRILDLIDIPAKVKFLSCEPLIGPVSSLHLEHIDWVIVGGESGSGARPIKKEWIDSILQECKRHRVKFFFKQWGKPGFNVNPEDPTIKTSHPNHAKGGCLLNGKVIREMPSINVKLRG